MTHEKISPLRERMIEDMRIHGMGDKAQKAHIQAIKDFAGFLKRPPDTATPDDLRAYQLHMTDSEVTPPTFNARIMALRFLFGTTFDREDMKRYVQFRTQPRRLRTVLSIEEVAEVIAAAPGPGLKYRAALSISYGAGLRAPEVCNLKMSDIDSDRMLIHVDEGKGGNDRKIMLSPDLLDLLSCIQFGQTCGRHLKTRHLAYHAPQLCNASAGDKHRRPRHSSTARTCQVEHDSALHPCRHQNHPGHAQPI